MVVATGDEFPAAASLTTTTTTTTTTTLGTVVGTPPSTTIDPYKSSRFIGHSLWMVPSRTVGGSLQAYDAIIGEMSKELGTFHFVPHITLVAGLMGSVEDIVVQTRRLASLVAPYEFEWDDDNNNNNDSDEDIPPLSYKDAYFQCVFARMKLTDTVVQANVTARQIFPEKQTDPPYTPHLSLIYGDFSEMEKKERLIPQLHQAFQAATTGQDADADAKNTTCYRIIPVDAIEIWSTLGDVKDWYLVERVPLAGTSTS